MIKGINRVKKIIPSRSIFAECDNDTVFIKSLGFTRRIIEHVKIQGKGQVLKKLGELKNNLKGVGIVDEDPGIPIPKILHNQYVITNGKYGIQIFQKIDDKSKIIIQIPENLEQWIKIIASRDQNLKSKMINFFKTNNNEFKENFHKNIKFIKFLEEDMALTIEFQYVKRVIEEHFKR